MKSEKIYIKNLQLQYIFIFQPFIPINQKMPPNKYSVQRQMLLYNFSIEKRFSLHENPTGSLF